MARRLALPLALLLLLLAAAVPAWSQDADEGPLPEPLAGWAAELKDISDDLKQTGPNDDALLAIRERLEKVQQKMDDHTATLKEQFGRIDGMLKELGPAPKDGEPAESEAAARVRQRLSERSAEFDGSIRTVQVLQTRAEQLLNEVQENRRDLFTVQLRKRVQSPVMPSLWRDVADDSAMMARAFGFLVANWWSKLQHPGVVYADIAASIVLWLVLGAVSLRLMARYRLHDPDEPPPPPLQRAASAAGVTLARATPPIAAALLLILSLVLLDMLPGTMHSIAIALLGAFCTVVVLMALVQTVLAPNQGMWRVFPADDRDARLLCWLGWGIAIVYGLDRFLAAVNSALAAPIPVTIAQSAITTVLVALMLAAMLRVRLVTPGQQQEEEEAETRSEEDRRDASAFSGSLPRILLWVLVATILVAVLLGYLAFARFLTRQIVVTGSILILFWLVHVTIEDFSQSLASAQHRRGRWLAARIPEQKLGQVSIAASMVFHLIAFAIFLPLIALQWGFDWEDLRAWLSKLVFGFQVGNWRISPITIILAVLLFIVGLIASGFFQRWLDTRVLTRAQLDQGARSAIRTGVGYLGIAVAALIAVSYAGLDFSNVAIVAGALSVGIGFGLQSIVNNFVSGLILLAERRVSVGDRIEVGAEQGFVRRISVRATEIETFDRNFVILPNSDLMTNAVKNWTFQNRYGRIVIDIGVSYASDPEQVKETLLKVAHDHPAIVDREKTKVWFTTFADSALIFRLVAFVGDINDLLDTRSDLHFAIMREFRAAGIEIPFPQRDINLRDIDKLGAAISGRMGGGRRKTAGS